LEKSVSSINVVSLQGTISANKEILLRQPLPVVVCHTGIPFENLEGPEEHIDFSERFPKL
jgi:hypothetical protein